MLRDGDFAISSANPYKPSRLETSRLPTRPNKLIRALSGLIAANGIIYLVSVIWLVFIPGAVIWLGWVSIAMGRKLLDTPAFWAVSLVWNAGWLALFSQTFGEPLGASYYLIGQLVAAVAVSVYALCVSLRDLTS